MPDYSIFGGVLRSEIVIPELRLADTLAQDWTLTTTDRAREITGPQPLGEAEIIPGCRVRLVKHRDGYRISFDDTGSYDVSADGRMIRWTVGPSPQDTAVRADVCGRVMTVALHAGGLLCLHGSAVAFAEGTVAFLAPKYHGKSTLALALTRAGARLVTDDILPVDISAGEGVEAVPGVHQVKLWGDSAEHFGVDAPDPRPGEKHLLHEFDDDRLMFERTPLVAVYLLAPVMEAQGAAPTVRREALHPVPSALALVRHAAMGELLGGSEARVVFDRAAAVASRVPVYRLDVVAGMARLDETVAQLLAWHGAPEPAEETAKSGG